MSARNYLALAEQCIEAAENNLAAGLLNPAVSAAVHAAICANDAVCLALIGERARGKAHGEAVSLLRRACRGTPYSQAVEARSRQLADVLAMKTEAEYSGSMVLEKQARRAVGQARRFVEWARGVVVSETA